MSVGSMDEHAALREAYARHLDAQRRARATTRPAPHTSPASRSLARPAADLPRPGAGVPALQVVVGLFLVVALMLLVGVQLPW